MLIKLAREEAERMEGVAGALTFRPHPRAILRPESALDLLLTHDEKKEVLLSYGLDSVIQQKFDSGFASQSPREFFRSTVLAELGARCVIVGFDFRFGKGREGSLEALSQECEASGVCLHVVPPYELEGERVSSSRIRELLMSSAPGALAKANRLLGRPFFYRGKIESGEGRGRELGFPTANFGIEGKLSLPTGVYVTRAKDLESGETFRSVTNFGMRPTFGERKELLVECHLLDGKRDLYGRTLDVQFLEFLRPERKFSGASDLAAQIGKDCQAARSFHAEQLESRQV